MRSSVPLTVTTPPPAVPSVLLTDFYTPASASSPALAIDQISPQQQQQQPHQWVLAPPTFTSQMPPPPPSSNASSLDSPYAQERRPSLKAQWEAIFPNEASDGSLSASSCSSSFPSSYRGTDSISPLWGMTLLPSLSISEPSYTDNSSLDMNLPGAFSLPSEMPEVEASEATPLAGLTSPAQFSFVPPALSLPSYSSSPNLEYWSSVPETAGLSPSTTPYFGLPAQATGNPPPLVNNPTLAQPALQVPDLPIWWAHRHVKVKPDEVDGIPLEDLIRQLNETKSS